MSPNGLAPKLISQAETCSFKCQARVEPHKILPMVSSDIDVLVIRGDEGSHEEASEKILTIPG